MKYFIIKTKDKIYTLEGENKNYQLLRDGGLEYLKNSDEYWSWWKDKAGYIGKEVDITILYADRLRVPEDINVDRESKTLDYRQLEEALESNGIEVLNYDKENEIIKLRLGGEEVKLGISKRLIVEKNESRKQVIDKPSKVRAKEVEAITEKEEIKVKKDKRIAKAEKEKEIKVPTKLGSIKEYYENKTKQCN